MFIKMANAEHTLLSCMHQTWLFVFFTSSVSLTKTAKKGLETKQNLIEEVTTYTDTHQSFLAKLFSVWHRYPANKRLTNGLYLYVHVFIVAEMCGHLQASVHLLCGKHEEQQIERHQDSLETQSVRTHTTQV